MKFVVVVSCLLAVACVKSAVVAPVAYSAVVPGFGYSTVSHHGVPVPYAAPVVHPYAYSAVSPYIVPGVAPLAALEKSQYHAQDAFGQATYGHAEAYQSHSAVQDAAGNKAGAYSYVAPNGEVISTKYVADGLGYRVESNAVPSVPAETPEVVAARSAHLKAFEEVKSRSRRAAVVVPTPYVAHPVAYSTPFVHTPVVARTAAYNTFVHTPYAQTSSFNFKHY